MERNTRQRRAIRRVIEEVDRPLSPQEVFKVAQAHAPGLGIATVYRTLKGLVEEGWLIQVELPGEPPRYETARKAHHHHFQCLTCEQVYEIEGCPQNVQPLTPSGFLLEGHYMVLYGQCATCAKTSGSR
jgi:Fur family ferric uptake transcriptional regulator